MELKTDLPSKRENSIVPFPREQIFSGEGSLELYFGDLVMPGGSFFAYNRLPDEFSSIGVEHYVNWLTQLTDKDPQHRERGAWLHIMENERIIYPSNPTIGRMGEMVNAIFSKNPHRFFPLTRTHSHPDGSCFSPQDLKRALASPRFVAEALGTQKRNYLLLRTDHTISDSPVEVSNRMNDHAKYIDEMAHKLDTILDPLVVAGDLPRGAADYFRRIMARAELAEFGTIYSYYYSTFAISLFLADEYKLGFYVSDKDGVYRKVKEDDLDQIMYKEEELIERTFDNLEKK